MKSSENLYPVCFFIDCSYPHSISPAEIVRDRYLKKKNNIQQNFQTEPVWSVLVWFGPEKSFISFCFHVVQI